jgi:hypothetical protein
LHADDGQRHQRRLLLLRFVLMLKAGRNFAVTRVAAIAFALVGVLTAFGPGIPSANAGDIIIKCAADQCASCQPMTVDGHEGVFCYCGGC